MSILKRKGFSFSQWPKRPSQKRRVKRLPTTFCFDKKQEDKAVQTFLEPIENLFQKGDLNSKQQRAGLIYQHLYNFVRYAVDHPSRLKSSLAFSPIKTKGRIPEYQKTKNIYRLRKEKQWWKARKTLYRKGFNIGLITENFLLKKIDPTKEEMKDLKRGLRTLAELFDRR